MGGKVTTYVSATAIDASTLFDITYEISAGVFQSQKADLALLNSVISGTNLATANLVSDLQARTYSLFGDTSSEELAFQNNSGVKSLVINGAGDVYNRGAGAASGATVFGLNAGRLMTSKNNTVFGENGLSNLTTGADNVAIGFDAGVVADDASLVETNNTSVYIGKNVKPSLDGNSNEIIIGYNSVGNGTNTVTIGNSSIVDNYLYGGLTVSGLSGVGDRNIGVDANGKLKEFTVSSVDTYVDAATYNSVGSLLTLSHNEAVPDVIVDLSDLKDSTFYNSDGTILGNRTILSSGTNTTWDGGNIIAKSDGVNDNGFSLNTSLDVFRGGLSYDVSLDTGVLELSNASGSYMFASDGFVGVGTVFQVGTEKLRVNGETFIGSSSAKTQITGNGVFIDAGGTTNANNFSVENDVDGKYFVVTSSGGDGRVGINNSSPDITSLLDLTNTTKGLLIPRMTTTQKNAISSPADWLMVIDITLGKICFYNGSAWETVTSS